jgi:hypothetical protein
MHHITRGQLEHRFGYHPPPTPDVAAAHGQVRSTLLDAADTIVELTGAPSREQSLAITKLEEAMMWANADIARKGAIAHPPEP